jgi:hypothetical protein
MKENKSLNSKDFIIKTDIDENLSEKDIYNDVKKLNWLIKKTEYKIKRYEENLKHYILRTKQHNEINKGLQAFNLLSKYHTEI